MKALKGVYDFRDRNMGNLRRDLGYGSEENNYE
jgi:hypothetical protein